MKRQRTAAQLAMLVPFRRRHKGKGNDKGKGQGKKPSVPNKKWEQAEKTAAVGAYVEAEPLQNLEDERCYNMLQAWCNPTVKERKWPHVVQEDEEGVEADALNFMVMDNENEYAERPSKDAKRQAISDIAKAIKDRRREDIERGILFNITLGRGTSNERTATSLKEYYDTHGVWFQQPYPSARTIP